MMAFLQLSYLNMPVYCESLFAPQNSFIASYIPLACRAVILFYAEKHGRNQYTFISAESQR